MAKEAYDVIIVGAGPVGLMLAKLLDDSRLDVLLIEKRKTIKKLENNIFATFRDVINKFDLKKAVIRDYPLVQLYGPESSVKFNFREKPLALLDLDKWAKKLKLQCEVKTGTKIVSVRRAKGWLAVLDSGKNRYKGKIVVDCSGKGQVVSSKLKIPKSPSYCACYIVGLENCRIPRPHEGSLAGDLRFANAGGWVYPFSKTKCQFGISDYHPYKMPYKKSIKKRAFEMIRKYKPYSDWLKGSKVVFELYKEAPPLAPHIRMVQDNFISVGDAGGQGTPFLGDCIRPGFEMAAVAAKTIKSAFRKNDFSRNALMGFEDVWHKKFGKTYIWSILIRHIWANEFSNKDITKIINHLQKLPKNEFYNFIRSDIHPGIFRKIIDVDVMEDVMLSFINKHIPHLKKHFKV